MRALRRAQRRAPLKPGAGVAAWGGASRVAEKAWRMLGAHGDVLTEMGGEIEGDTPHVQADIPCMQWATPCDPPRDPLDAPRFAPLTPPSL